MLADSLEEDGVHRLLGNLELKVVLDSPGDDYRIEYFTTSIKDRQTGEPRLTRTYRLLDLARNGITPEPWDTFDLHKQTKLVVNLIRLSRYRVAKIVSGWEVVCPVCGHTMRGRIWQPAPRTCTAEVPRTCRTRIDEECVVEVLSAAAEY